MSRIPATISEQPFTSTPSCCSPPVADHDGFLPCYHFSPIPVPPPHQHPHRHVPACLVFLDMRASTTIGHLDWRCMPLGSPKDNTRKLRHLLTLPNACRWCSCASAPHCHPGSHCRPQRLQVCVSGPERASPVGAAGHEQGLAGPGTPSTRSAPACFLTVLSWRSQRVHTDALVKHRSRRVH